MAVTAISTEFPDNVPVTTGIHTSIAPIIAGIQNSISDQYCTVEKGSGQ